MARSGHARSLPVGYKVIVPFAGLSLLVGMVVSAVASHELAASAGAQLDHLATREEDAVTSSFTSFQQRELTLQRGMAGTVGVPQALAQRDHQSLQEALWPLVANQYPDPVFAAAIGPDGREVVGVSMDPSRPGACACVSGMDMGGWPHVKDALAGRSDSRGSKFAGLDLRVDGGLLYVVGPVTASGRVVGVMLAGEPISYLLSEMRSESDMQAALFSAGGQPLAHDSGFPLGAATLSPSNRLHVLDQSQVVRADVQVMGAPAEVFFVPWQMRGEIFGYAAVLVQSSAVGAAAGNVSTLLLGIFLCSFLLTFIAGLFVTRGITRPLRALLHATDQVAAGNLAYRSPIATSDEIGQLSDSFNRMTATLQERTQRLEAATEATVQTLAATIDARDAYTHGHSLRVARYSRELALAAALSEEDMEVLRRGCLVHDLGKIGVPDHVLTKPGRLDPVELDIMRRHAVTGYEMLLHAHWGTEVLEIVRHHHERWDGEGYPDRLTGEHIPRLARLVMIADTLDAMTSHRPYRPAFNFDSAAAEIIRGAGAQFDPAMVEAFKRVRPVLRGLLEQDAGRPADVLPKAG